MNPDPSTPPPATPPKKPGGQPGNTNALKHGFYAHSFTDQEKERLDNGYLGELNDEEALLHIFLSRTAESMKDRELSHEEYVIALRAVSIAIGRIESLHRSRKVIYDHQTTIEKALDELKYIPLEED